MDNKPTLCPKCKVSGVIHDDGFVEFWCGSSLSLDDSQMFARTKACSELEFRDTIYVALVKACEEFRETVLHGVFYGLNNDQTNEVLDLFDDVIGSQY